MKKSFYKKSYIKYIFSMLLFGTNGIVASFISLTSYEIVFFRTLIGGLFLVMLFFISGEKSNFFSNKKHFFYIVLSGISMGVSWMFLYEAYQQIGVSLASLAYYSGPVIVLVLSPILFNEKLGFKKVFGFLIVFFGMVFLNLQGFQETRTFWGFFCGIMSALMYSLMVIFNKKATSILGIKNSMIQLCTAFLTVTIFLAFKQGFIFHIASSNWIPILVLGLINTGLGCYLYFSSIGYLPVQTVAIFGYTELVSAVIFSYFFLSEKLTILQVIGGFLIVGGAIFADASVKFYSDNGK